MMPESTRNRVSVLIAAYKTPDLVRQCLDSLIEVCGGVLPETIIVDDAAGDPEMKACVVSYSAYGVKLLVMPKNGGFAGANNFGFPHCTKEFVTLVNTDIVFHEDSFTPLVEFMDSHPAAQILQGKLVIKNGDPKVEGHLNGCGAMLTPLGTTVTPGWLAPADDPSSLSAHPCFAAYGAFFMVRRNLPSRVGGLFHDHFHMYYEEVDLCHRTWLSGGEVWYVPTPIIDHAHSVTTGRFNARANVLKKFYRNMRFSFLTCFGWRGLITIVPVFEFLCFGQAVVQLLKGNLTGIRAHVWALWHLVGLWGDIRRVRNIVQGCRVINDAELFKKVMRHYTWREFWQLIARNS